MKNKILNKLLGVLLVVMALFSTLFVSAIPIQAEELDLWERTGYNYTGISPQLGYATTHESIPVSKLDGKIVVFCIEAGIYTHSGVTYYSENFIHSKKDILSKIVYYGYTNTSQSHYDYAVTQVMVWEELGDQYVSSTIPNYHQRKAEILAQVSKHDTLPSWHNQSVKVQVGSSLTLEDINGVFNGMNLTANPTGIGLTRAGNKMTLTPTATSNNGTISFQKVDGGMVGNSIVYRSQGYQTLVEFHLDSTKQTNLNVTVIKLGNARVQKIDEDTGKPLANATIKFEYNGVTKELVTDENGSAEISDIPESTQVTISEVTAPDGFVNKGEIRTVTIDPTPIPFEFTYEGQEIELVSESVTAQNDCQRLKLLLHKNEETITGWKGNLASH